LDKLIDQILAELVEDIADVELRGEYLRPDVPNQIDATAWASDIYGSPDQAQITRVSTGISDAPVAASNIGPLYYPTFLGLPSPQRSEKFLYALEYARTNNIPILAKQGLIGTISPMFDPGLGKTVNSNIIPAQLATDEHGQIPPEQQKLFKAVIPLAIRPRRRLSYAGISDDNLDAKHLWAARSRYLV
ncbi:MAG: hypothetical protein ACE10A_03980, partial [Acidiferrobacterales bacterium]